MKAVSSDCQPSLQANCNFPRPHFCHQTRPRPTFNSRKKFFFGGNRKWNSNLDVEETFRCIGEVSLTFLCFISIYSLTRRMFCVLAYSTLTEGKRQEISDMKAAPEKTRARNFSDVHECHEVLFAWDGKSFSLFVSTGVFELPRVTGLKVQPAVCWIEIIFSVLFEWKIGFECFGWEREFTMTIRSTIFSAFPPVNDGH